VAKSVDMKAIKDYHKRMDERLAARGVKFDGYRYDFNEKHDKLGAGVVVRYGVGDIS